MGWNDARYLGYLSEFSAKYIKFSILPLILLLAFNIELSAQGSPQKGEPAIDTTAYRVAVRYPLKVYSRYKLVEQTEIKRTYSDGSNKDYTRDITYYLTQFVSKLPEDGFNTVSVTIDSMIYDLKDGEKTYHFDSQAHDKEIPNIQDLTAIAIPLGRTYDMIYSPYNEVVRVEGEDLDWLKDYVLVKGKDILDTIKKTIWMRGISDTHLAYLADLQKNTIPSVKVRKDTVWFSPFKFQFDGITFFDTAQSRIAEYNAGVFTIESRINNMKPLKEAVILYDINTLVTADSGKFDGTYSYKLRPNGTITYAEANFQGVVYPKIRNEVFTQMVKKRTIWELLDQFKW
jgi:hypothetical protein